jgi:uncharacterized membrane protein
MKQQVARFSPHQNAKVMAALMAVISIVFFLPFALIGSMFGMGPPRGSFWMFIVVPILYFVVTYVMFVIWCALYNALVPVIGGFEYEPATPAS